MSLRINQNVMSLKTHGTLSQTSGRLEKSIEKLSSGLRINRAADDAAGLAISEKLRRQIRGLSRAVLNAQDGISMIQSAEGALNESQSILQRMRELAIQSSNDTLTSNDRLEVQKEVNQLRDDLNRIAHNTEFNTKKLLDGSQTALISASSAAVKGLVTGSAGGVATDAEVSIALIQGGISQMQRSQIFTLKDDGSILAKGGTQLQSIGQFYDANGVFVLESPQTLTINANSKSTTLVIDGQMTLDKLAAGIQNALVSSTGVDLTNSRAQVVNTTQTTVAGLGGYIEVVSGSIGEKGDIAIAADQGVVNALGLAITRESKNNLVEVTLKDSMGNTTTARTESDRVTGLLDGVDIRFASQAAQIAGSKGLEQGINITVAQTFIVSVNGTQLTVSATTTAWTLAGLARSFNEQFSAVAALKGLTATVVENELRLSYEKPASAAASVSTNIVIDGATNAATIGFTNGTYAGFTDAAKDKNNIVWGFSKYDITSNAYTVNFTIDDGTAITTIGVYSSFTTATTADMMMFSDFQATVNAALVAASVKVRVDQAGAAIAFTSTRVGTQNVNGSAPLTSILTFALSAGASTVGVNDFKSLFGINEGTAKGSGDQNFRVHVVNNSPQFHIGADQGQVMRITMANMSADALDVDNLDMTSIEAAAKSLGKINQAIDKVSSERSKLGAFQNRLEYSINNLRNTHSNLSAAESRIRDADVAMEMIEFTRNQIVSQSGTAMLAQANLVPQGVLQLLR